MKFLPLNDHIEVKPIQKESFIASNSSSFEEKGTVVSVADGIKSVKAGDVVYFDSWMSARYPDADGNERYLVPESAIRAVEYD